MPLIGETAYAALKKMKYTISRSHTFIQKSPLLLAGLCILVGSIARAAAIRPLTNNPLVRAPFMDDGFYYLEIARNVVTRGQFTFDGIHPTNGFHPLWELMLVLIARLSADDFVFIRLVMYFGILWFVLGGILLYKFVAGYGGDIAGLAAVILWSLSPDLFTWQNQGMENTIFLPILIFALIMVDHYLHGRDGLRWASLLGLTFGVLMWSRSDSLLFVLLALAAILLVSWRESGSVKVLLTRQTLALLGIPFASGIGYLLFNQFAAGSYLSVSGVVKISDSSSSLLNLSQVVDALRVHLSMIWDLFSDLGGLVWWGFNWRIFPFRVLTATWIIVALVWWGGYLARNLRKQTPATFRTEGIGLVLLFVYSLIHSFLMVTVLKDQVRWTPWYLVPQVLSVSVAVPLILFPKSMLNDVFSRVRGLLGDVFTRSIQGYLYPAGSAALVLAIFGACFWALAVPIKEIEQMVRAESTLEPRYELAMWLKKNAQPNAVVGMFDAGVAGYFSHVHIVNLDGLVNSPDYVSVRRSGAYADYVVQNRFDYVVQYYYPPYRLEWGKVTDDSHVCYQLMHTNQYPAPWGPENVNNYFEVMALRYDGNCDAPWKPGFPLVAVPPE